MIPDTLDAETRAFLCDASRLRRLRDRLRHAHRRIISAETLWTVFADIYPDLPTGSERRLWLLVVLEELAARGDILLPVRHGKQWDRTSRIALPTAVKLTTANAALDNRTGWREFPWHPQLQWVLQLRNLADDQFLFLRRVNQGFVEGWFARAECFKYRSLQLTGDEKRLETLLKGKLFEPGCLTLELLGCALDVLPLATDYLTSNPRMLVFENAAPFLLAKGVAAEIKDPGFGRLAYGAGKQVLKAVPYFSVLQPPVTDIQYVGDLDAEGLKIAAEVQRLSQAIPVRSAMDFHVAMLESATALGAEHGWPVKDPQPNVAIESAISFLDPCLQDRVAAIIAAGRRVPEEAISRAAMATLLGRS